MSEGSEKISGTSGDETPKGRSPKELKKLYRQGRIAAPQSKQGAPESPPQTPSERPLESEERAVVLEMLKDMTDFVDIRDVMETFAASFPEDKRVEAIKNVLTELPEEKRGVVRDSLKKALKKEDYDKLAEVLPASTEIPPAATEAAETEPAAPEVAEVKTDTGEKSEGWKIIQREIFNASTSADAEEMYRALGPEADMTRGEFIVIMRERTKARQELVESTRVSPVVTEEVAPEEEKASRKPEEDELVEVPTEAKIEIPWKETIMKETANVRAAREVLSVFKDELLERAETLKEISEARQVITSLDAAMIEGKLPEDEELLAISGMSTREARKALKDLALKTAATAGFYGGIANEQNPVLRLRETIETVEDPEKKAELRAVVQEIVRREIHIVAEEVKGIIEIRDPVLLEMMEETAERMRARYAERHKMWDKVKTALRITRRRQPERLGMPRSEPKMSAYENEISKWVGELKAHPKKLDELEEGSRLHPEQREEIEKRLEQIKKDEKVKSIKEVRKAAFDEIRIAMEEGVKTLEGRTAVPGLKESLEGASLPLGDELVHRIQRVLGTYVKIRALSDEIRELERVPRF